MAEKKVTKTKKKAVKTVKTPPVKKEKKLTLLEVLLLGSGKYDEKLHCELAIDIFGDKYKGTVADVCKAFIITEREFNEWRRDYPSFNKSVEYGLVLAKLNWQNEPEAFEEERDELQRFDLNKWKFIGKYRFGIGDQPKIQVHIDKNLNPVEQYGQLLDLAAMGNYSASEFKQVSEAINIGIRAHETFNMQKELDDLKQTLVDIQERNASNGFNIPTDTADEEADSNSL